MKHATLNDRIAKHAPLVDSDPYVLDFERELAGPNGPELRAHCLAQFCTQLSDIEARMRTGLSPENFSRTEQVRCAVETAIRVLENVRPTPLINSSPAPKLSIP